MSASWLRDLFDPYGRTARLYPALIFLSPLVWHALAWGIDVTVATGWLAAAGLMAASIVYLLASLARSQGKRVEEKLIKKWGGWPTTAVLRHSDGTFDPVTKARYHTALGEMCALQLPDAAGEAEDRAGADSLYRSVTRRLIEQRRGDRYVLLHAENASYGFRRNLLGLRPAAIALAVSLVAGTIVAVALPLPEVTAQAFGSALQGSPRLAGAILLDALYGLFFGLVVTESFVRQASLDYAQALCKTLDMPKD